MTALIQPFFLALSAVCIVLATGLWWGIELTTRKRAREYLDRLREQREYAIRDKIETIAKLRRESDPTGHFTREVGKLKKENANLHLINLKLTERINQLESICST